MAFIETSLTAKLAIRGRLFNNDVVNTLWFEKTDEAEWIASELADLAADVASWWESSVLLLLSDDYSVADYTATAQYNTTAPSVVVVAAVGTEGGDPSVSLPSSNCITVTFLTNVRGRSWRGRNYISGIPASSADDNQVDASFADGLVGCYVGLNGFITSVSAQHVVVSHYSGKLPRNSGVTVPITGYRYHDRDIDSQRRRLNGRGS